VFLSVLAVFLLFLTLALWCLVPQETVAKADLVVSEYEEKMSLAAVYMEALNNGACPAALLLTAKLSKKGSGGE
jgi:hypothetical protein